MASVRADETIMLFTVDGIGAPAVQHRGLSKSDHSWVFIPVENRGNDGSSSTFFVFFKSLMEGVGCVQEIKDKA